MMNVPPLARRKRWSLKCLQDRLAVRACGSIHSYMRTGALRADHMVIAPASRDAQSLANSESLIRA